MDRSVIQQRLAETEERIANGENQFAQQRRLFGELELRSPELVRLPQIRLEPYLDLHSLQTLRCSGRCTTTSGFGDRVP